MPGGARGCGVCEELQRAEGAPEWIGSGAERGPAPLPACVLTHKELCYAALHLNASHLFPPSFAVGSSFPYCSHWCFLDPHLQRRCHMSLQRNNKACLRACVELIAADVKCSSVWLAQGQIEVL